MNAQKAEGSNGFFTGKGYIVVPFLGDAKLAVVFNSIRVNTKYQLYEGVADTGSSGEAPQEGPEGPTAAVPVPVDSVVVVAFPIDSVAVKADGTVHVIGKDGTSQTLKGGKSYSFTGSDGQTGRWTRRGRSHKAVQSVWPRP